MRRNRRIARHSLRDPELSRGPLLIVRRQDGVDEVGAHDEEHEELEEETSRIMAMAMFRCCGRTA